MVTKPKKTKKTTRPAGVKRKSKVTRKIIADKKAASKPVKAAPESKSGKMTVMDLSGKTVGELVLDTMFTDSPANQHVIYQAVIMYQAGEREGSASTKDRGAVSGGGKKPWKQKGTGQARHGSTRSPIWRHGGTTFGPAPRDYSYSIPRQLRQKAVVETFKDKFQSGKLVIVENVKMSTPKTKAAAKALKLLKLEKPLFVVEQIDANFALSCRNLRGVHIKRAIEVNALDIAAHRECVVTPDAHKTLVKRLKK
ncbi:MAG: 50S ribosomal protein L4 [Candidatus Omnitrophota bacterium]